ncbi:MAG: RNA methyltransferase [Bacteroidetes bacterium]|nr:RNA methyltransferase [Bacteroidota bacterium]
MLSKNQIKLITSLKIKKFREEHGLFCVEGIKMVSELLAQNKFEVVLVFATEKWIELNKNTSHKKNIEINSISLAELNKISQLTSPNEVLALVKIPENKLSDIKIENELILVLDDINDPGNLGTIIRTADWFGIKSIVCSENTVDLYNFKVIQSTMGSVFRVDLYYTSIYKFLSKNKKTTKIYGALLDGTSIYQANLSHSGIIVIGNESKGISKEIVEIIENKIKIPSFSSNNESAESLNASIATAIICSEFRKTKTKTC